MNGLGTITTAVVLIVILQTKFLAGAWSVLVSTILLVMLFLAINRHYKYVAERLSLENVAPRSYLPRPKTDIINQPAVVVVGQLNQVTVLALDYARSIADEVVAIHVDMGSTDRTKLLQQWQKLESDVTLEILDSPYRSIVNPIVDFVSDYEKLHSGLFSTVIIPAVVTRNWWQGLLHNQTGFFLKAALRAHKSRVVTTVRYYL